MDKLDQSYSKAQAYTDGQGLSGLKLKARAQSPDAIKGVAKQFEALFLQMMLKSMRDSSLGDGLFDSEQGKMYMDLFDKQIALELAKKGSFGMAQVIQRQLGQVIPGDKKKANSNASALLLAGRPPSMQFPVLQKAQIKRQIEKILQANNNALKSEKAETHTKLDNTKTLMNKTDTQFESPLHYAKSIWGDVKVIAKKLGVNPMAILAQSILETGWGKHVARNQDGSSSNNLFGIKAGSIWTGKTASAKTNEYTDGKRIEITQGFRSYDSAGQSLADYARLLKNNPRYDKVLKNGSSVAGFAQAIQNSGYATDPKYATKILEIINGPTFKNVMKQLVK